MCIIHNWPFSPFLKGRVSTSQDWFVTGVRLPKLGHALGMSTKPLHRLAHHCMGLSSRDNWLSIRDRDNSVRVSRKAVNHYLSVRQPRLPGSCLHFLQSLSLFFSYTWFTLKYPALSLSLIPSHVSLPAGITSVYSSILSLHTTFPWGDCSIHQVKTSEWVVPILKVSPCHQLIVATQVLLKGQTVSVTSPRLHTLTHVGC